MHTQLPPGGATEEYRRFLAVWLREHDCAHHVRVTGATGRDYCCRIAPGGPISSAALAVPAVGLIAAGALLTHLWLRHRREQTWLTTGEPAERE